MTWTVLFMEDFGEEGALVAAKTVTAPHGGGIALQYIENTYNLDVVAIIPGNHNVFTEANGIIGNISDGKTLSL